MGLRSSLIALATGLVVVLGTAPLQPLAAQAVVQALPPPALADLNSALKDLATSPRSVSVLLRAGWASIGIDDQAGALGFFRRAEAVDPKNGEVKAGLATISLRQDDPIAAVRLFDEAEAAGQNMERYSADRGLALDLVGNNFAAQQNYRLALARENNPEVVRRMALSQAISGDGPGSEKTLLPQLLGQTDLAAYRTRAFALAILGQSEEAVSIAETMLPASLSNRMAPYLRYMPRLTHAQQAAAANLGRFPPAAEIGRDSPEIAAVANQVPPMRVASRTPDSRLEPTGEPLGGPARITRVTAAGAIDPNIRPSPQPVVVAVASPVAGPAVSRAANVAPQQAPPETAPAPSLSSGRGPQPAAAESTPDQASLAEVFADFLLPPAESASLANGAVDITRIEPKREKPKDEPKAEAKAKPKPPAHPKRYWVQVATGRDLKRLAFDWRKIKREGGNLLAKEDAFSVKWGQTNRLVTGPFANAAEAQKAVGELKKKGLSTFAFTSDEGEAVSPLR